MNKNDEKKLMKLEAEVERLKTEEKELLIAYRKKHAETIRAIRERDMFVSKKEDKKNLKDIEKLIKKLGSEEALRRLMDI